MHYHASDFKGKRRLAVAFYGIEMELGENLREYLLRADRMVKELERVNRPVNLEDIDVAILRGLTSQCDAKVRILESLSD